jgi:hypothetical protein
MTNSDVPGDESMIAYSLLVSLKNQIALLFVLSALLTTSSRTFVSAAPPKPPVPDLTTGGQPDDKHDWTLGPTGARGWIWAWKLETTDARQILVTKVDEGSPADGRLEVGDVILGINRRPFDQDARIAFGNAITEAEKQENGGRLSLLVHRDDRLLMPTPPRTEMRALRAAQASRITSASNYAITLQLEVLGDYAPTSPYGCEKSQRIVDAGCHWIADNMQGGIDGNINSLALLATGKEEYADLVREHARNVGRPDLSLRLHSDSGMSAWSWGYANLYLTEYYLATGDEYVLPAIREYSANIARGQSQVGTWGHGMAWPDANGGEIHGRLGGYGALNQAGLICHLSMAMAQRCGVEDPEVDAAVDLANEFFEFYVDKGAIPYGDHRPGWQVHDDNGKNSIASVIFDVQGQEQATQYFSRMTVASYGERERGHTGNYFSFLWGPLGAARAGDEAAAAYLAEQRWFYDMARHWDGSFSYQGAPGMGGGEHKYGGWDCTGAFVLAYALPQGNLFMTGRGTDTANILVGEELDKIVASGAEFSNWDMGVGRYEAMSDDELYACLGSWSPAVRSRAAKTLAGRLDEPTPTLLDILENGTAYQQYGACLALGEFRAKAATAVDALTERLWSEDRWLRIRSAQALAQIGPEARTAVPDLLRLAAYEDPKDPREMVRRYVSFALFYPGGALGTSGLVARNLDNVDREELYEAVRTLLQHPDGRSRGAVGSVYTQLTFEEIRPILPAIHKAVVEVSPSGVMFGDGIRTKGLELLAQNKIAEGMPLCIELLDLDRWGKRTRIDRCLKTLATYGGAAKPMLPALRDVEQQLLSHREARNLEKEITQIRDLIEEIEAAEIPEEPLRSIDDLID